MTKAPISQYQIELLARARARIAKSQVRYGEKVAYPADMHLVIDLVAQIESLTSALEADAAIRAMPLQDHAADKREVVKLALMSLKEHELREVIETLCRVGHIDLRAMVAEQETK